MLSQTSISSLSEARAGDLPARRRIMNYCGVPLIGVLGISLALLCSCEKKEQIHATPKPKVIVAPPLAPRFKAACDEIVAGKYEEAAAAFAQINVENDPSQPLYNWIVVQEGLALMLGGKDEEARTLFGKLEDAGMFSDDPDDKKLGKFFVNLAHMLRTEDPVPEEFAKDSDKWTYDAFRLLFAGLKDWNQEKFDDAIPLLRQFVSAEPKGPALWIGDEGYVLKLKDMCGSFADDYGHFRDANERLAKAKTPEEKQEAITDAKTMRAAMKYPSKLTRSLDATFADLSPKVMAAVKENQRLSSEAEAADLKLFATAKEKGDLLMKQYRFVDAEKAYGEPELKQEDRIDQQKDQVKKAQWLASFKSNMIKDLNRVPFPGPLTTNAGKPIAGTVVKANDQQLQIKTPQGVFPAQWTDLSQDTVLAIGESFIHPDTPPTILAFRKWQLGVFASVIGKKADSLKLLKEAAELRPAFKPELEQFQKSDAK